MPGSHASATPPRRRPTTWRVAVPLVCVGAGLLAATSFVSSEGIDLRGGRSADLNQLVLTQRDQVGQLRAQVRALHSEIETLSTNAQGRTNRRLHQRIDALAPVTEMTPVEGPGVSIALQDAPRDVDVPDDTDPNVLVVHQQDIQGVVNALWAGGASGVTVQGQRITSTTGIKCVGNTVVLEGVPYSPPYVIEAVGNTSDLVRALDESAAVQNYLSYTAPPYRLGWSYRELGNLRLPGYSGAVDLSYARPVD